MRDVALPADTPTQNQYFSLFLYFVFGRFAFLLPAFAFCFLLFVRSVSHLFFFCPDTSFAQTPHVRFFWLTFVYTSSFLVSHSLFVRTPPFCSPTHTLLRVHYAYMTKVAEVHERESYAKATRDKNGCASMEEEMSFLRPVS